MPEDEQDQDQGISFFEKASIAYLNIAIVDPLKRMFDSLRIYQQEHRYMSPMERKERWATIQASWEETYHSASALCKKTGRPLDEWLRVADSKLTQKYQKKIEIYRREYALDNIMLNVKIDALKVKLRVDRMYSRHEVIQHILNDTVLLSIAVQGADIFQMIVSDIIRRSMQTGVGIIVEEMPPRPSKKERKDAEG